MRISHLVFGENGVQVADFSSSNNGKTAQTLSLVFINVDYEGVSCLISVTWVKRLQWKFRGNHTILVEGLAVEVFWDVHSWLFSASPGNAVFMFKTCLSAEKLWGSQPFCDPNVLSLSFSQRFSDSKSQCLGFSLILHAWKNE
ncbi:hypothetical protein SDJN03_09015, partial [Cucurbita argyrosperma subsp. sororia]